MPAQAGIHVFIGFSWIPAFAGMTERKTMLGILCGFEEEAKVARQLSPLVAMSGAREHLAKTRAEELVKKGAKILLSFGVAGGLMPGITSDHIIIGERVVSREKTWNCDEAFVSLLASAVPHARKGSVFGSAQLVPGPEEKKNLFAFTGGLIVDMESQVIAETATAHGLPFSVLRGVSDEVEHTFPPAALVGINDDGSMNLKAIVKSLMKQPKQLHALLTLGKNTNRALKHLSFTVPKLQPLLAQI
jgi:adenosylhomocysteine nucleosidase